MEESGSGLVHGGVERYRDLETVVCRSGNQRILVWRIQSARVRHLLGLVITNREPGDEYVEVGRGSASAQTGGERADGTVAKGASEISYSCQETNYSLFRFLRSQPVRTLLSLRTRGDQHHHCGFLHAVLPAAGLALLVCHLRGGLFASLSWRALAQ